MTDNQILDLLAIEAYAWTPHLEIAVEICLQQAASGRRVGFVFLDVEAIEEVRRQTRMIQPIRAITRRSRLKKVQRLENILRARGVTVLPHRIPVPGLRLTCADAGIRSIEELRNFRFEGAAIGLGVLSSLVRHVGDSHPDFDHVRPLIDRILTASYQAFRLAGDVIEECKPREVLVYNGRMACSKGITEAARRAGVGVLLHETGGTFERFFVAATRSIQSSDYGRAYLRAAWSGAGEGREELAAQFFAPSRGGLVTPSHRFLVDQRPGHSIEPTGRRRIVYFVSTIDEYVAVEEGVEHPVFASQRCAVEWLVEWVRALPDTELVIRLHPRMRQTSRREHRWWDSLAADNVIVVPPDSPVDSQALASSAKKVVCYHSSMGPESTYRGTPAILVGDADYRGLDCVYEPATVAEFQAMLEDDSLPPKPRENCLPYGYAQLMWGEPFRFYRPTSFAHGSFFGEEVAPFREPASVAVATFAVYAVDRVLRMLGDRFRGLS